MKYKIEKSKILKKYDSISEFCRTKGVTRNYLNFKYAEGFTFDYILKNELGEFIANNQKKKYNEQLKELQKKLINELGE